MQPKLFKNLNLFHLQVYLLGLAINLKNKELKMAINQINENEIEVSVEAVEKAGISPSIVNDAIKELIPMALLEACGHDKSLLIEAISKAGKKFIEFQCSEGSWSDTKHDEKRLKLITSIASSRILTSLSEKIDELNSEAVKSDKCDCSSAKQSEQDRSLDALVDALMQAARKAKGETSL